MLFPQCPRCSNRLKISAFFVLPKKERNRIEKMGFFQGSREEFTCAPKVQCNKCMATVTINPKIYLFLTIVWTIVGVAVLFGILLLPGIIGRIAFISFLAKLLLGVVLAGFITILLCWRFLEVIEDKEHDV